MIKRVLKLTFIALLFSIGCLYVLFTPPYATQVTFNQNKIRIIRDSFGIPHIQAPNRRSFLYAWRYAIAEDRLFQISFRRILAQGRLSEFLGSRFLQSDIFMRDLIIDQVSIHTANKVKAENQTVHLDMSAFAQGINDQVASRLVFPLQYYVLGLKWEPWNVAAIILLYKSFLFGISHNMMEEYARSTLLINKIIPNTKETWAFPSKNAVKDEDIPEYLQSSNKKTTGIFEPLQIQNIIELGIPEFFFPQGGSNGWAVSGQHTQSGKPILQADPHLDNIIPSNLYQFTTQFVQNNRTIKYLGAGPPGVTLSIGKSDYFAMSITVCQTDTQDLYKQNVQGNKYLVDTQWRDLRIRNQNILVKEGNKLIEHKHRVRLTHRGPILTSILSPYGNYLLDEPISLAWVGHNEDYQSFINTGLYMREIDNLQDLREALINGTSHYLNMHVVAATVDNHLLYQQSGINPIRRNVTMGSYFKDGTNSQNDQLSFMPAHERMHAIDPKSGYFATSNQRVTSDLFGDYYHHMIFTGRADRLIEGIEQEIASGRKMNSQFAVKLIQSTLDVYCRQILPQLFVLSPKIKENLSALIATLLLSPIKLVSTKPSCTNFGTSLFSFSQKTKANNALFQINITVALIKPVKHQSISFLGMHVFPQCQYNAIHDAFNGDLQKQAAVHRAWDLGLNRLLRFFKTEDHTQWKWGLMLRDRSINTAFGNHPYLQYLFNREAPGFGNYHTVNIANYIPLQTGNFKTSKRSTVRMVFDLGRDDDQWILDTGISQNILSKHYDDQWQVFMQRKLAKVQWPVTKDQEL